MTPSSLLALEGKLVEAKEGSREIDLALYRMFALAPEDVAVFDSNIAHRKSRLLEERNIYTGVPQYTSSIDFALALVSRCLPGHGYSMSYYKNASVVFLHPPNDGPPVHVCAATMPLAICLALVRSLKGAGK